MSEHTDHVLDLIDRTLGDSTVSEDAMRSVPEPETLPDCRHESCVGLGGGCRWVDHHGVLPHPDGPAGPLGEGWHDVGYTTDDGVFGPDGIEVTVDHRIPPGMAVLIHSGGQEVTVGPFPAPPPPNPRCGHWRCVGAESCRWRAQVAAAYDVPESMVDPRGRFGPLPGPLAHFTADEHGNIVDQHGRIVFDRSRVRAALDKVNEVARVFREQAPAVLRAYARVGAHLRAAGVLPRMAEGGRVQPPPDPWQRALQARRNRNTGPAWDPHRHRGMS